MPALSLTPATDHDQDLLASMLREAAMWRDPEAGPPTEVLLADPELARYVAGWGRPGDVGVVARLGELGCGAAWARRFPADAPGYGFVDADTPELSIAVAAPHRGIGLGRALLTTLLVELRRRGTAQVSLSVEMDNPARELYTELGFVVVGEGAGDVRMLRRLGSGEPPPR